MGKEWEAGSTHTHKQYLCELCTRGRAVLQPRNQVLLQAGRRWGTAATVLRGTFVKSLVLIQAD